MALNLMIRFNYSEESHCNNPEDCNLFVRSWESCAPTSTDSQIVNAVTVFDSSASFLAMAIPMMLESVINRIIFLLNNDDQYLGDINSSLVSFATVRYAKGAVSDISERFNLEGMKRLSARPNIIQECRFSKSSGFPSGHAFTLLNRAMEHIDFIVQHQNQENRKSLYKHYVCLFFSIYAGFTRYTLQWHTTEQLFYTGLLSILFRATYKYSLDLLRAKGLPDNILEKAVNYLGHFLIIGSFEEKFFKDFYSDAMARNFLSNPVLFYSSMLTTSAVLDGASYLFFKPSREVAAAVPAVVSQTLENRR